MQTVPVPGTGSSNPGVGARLQLAAVGAQDTYLRGTHSHFRTAFRRATRFITWTDDFPIDYRPGARVQADVPKSGDLLADCYLLVTLPIVPGGGTWPANVGYSLFRRIRLLIDETEVHNIERLWYDLHDKLYARAGHLRGLNAMVGRTPLSKSKRHELYLPLRFLTCGRGSVRAPLPLCAMTRSSLKIDVEWEFLDVLGATVDPGITARVVVDYVELDEPERRSYLKPVTLAFDSAIDSDATSYYIDSEGEVNDAAKIRVNLGNVRFPVKMLVFVAYQEGTLFQYLDGMLDYINVTFDNQDRFFPRPLSYFQNAQRYAHCRRSDASGPPGVYSFAIDGTSRKNTGAADFGGLKKVYLEANVARRTPRFRLKVFSVYTNFLRVGSGTAALGLV